MISLPPHSSVSVSGLHANYDTFVLQSASAAILLAFVCYQALFCGIFIGFIGSASLVVSVLLPSPKKRRGLGFMAVPRER